MVRASALVVASAMAATLLSACGGDVKTTKITPELLEKPELAQKVANRLAPEDRQIFSRYLLGRAMSGTALGALGKPLVNAAGRDPATVGEAIELVKANDALEARRSVLRAERDAKEAVLEAKREKLNAAAEAAGWASAEVDAANAVIPEIDALRKDYDDRIARLK